MQFDPAVAAQLSLARSQETGELGEDEANASVAEETFSTTSGDSGRAAFYTLLEIGLGHPDARAFQEFLIYITWQQVTDEMDPAYFRTGLELCDHYLSRWGDCTDDMQVQQVSELRTSFRNGLGLDFEEDHDYDKDALKGGD